MIFKNKTFLITGGAGFVGSHTAAALIKKGARVVIVDNLSTGKKANIHPEATFYKLNLTDPRLEAIFRKEKPEYVYHFAFNVQVPKSVEDPAMDAESILASLNLFKYAAKAKIRKVVFSSSSFVYGNNPSPLLKETAPIDPLNPYIISKHAVENYLNFYRIAHGLPYVVLRYATVFGPRQVMGAMADYIRTLKADKQAQIWGDGTKTRDYVFVEDVVRANLLALSVPDDLKSPIFNVGTGVETTLNEVYQTIAKILKKPAEPIYLPDRPGELMRYSIDHSKIRKELGWTPQVTVQAGIRKILRS
jgi:UDP-glucose 4-epimerase